jgi:hypothetical protein
LKGAVPQSCSGNWTTNWQLNPDGHLDRAYSFENFAKAIALANKVANHLDPRFGARRGSGIRSAG